MTTTTKPPNTTKTLHDLSQQHDEQSPLLPSSTPSTLSTTTSSPNTGRSWLFLVALLYGTLNVTLRGIYAQPHPPTAAALSTSRGWLAVLCFLPLLLHSSATTATSTSRSSSSSSSILVLHKQAMELALWNFGAQGLANIGLWTVPSARAAFLTQTSVVWTPVLASFLVPFTVIQKRQWMACGVCLCGLGVLSSSSSSQTSLSSDNNDNNESHGNHNWANGILLLGAACWSMYIVRLSVLSHQTNEFIIVLQAYKNVYLAALYSVWWLVQSYDWVDATTVTTDTPWTHNAVVWMLLLYSALGPGTLADIWQQQGQLHVSATESNVWLSLEPVFTALLGWLCLQETLSFREMGGGALVISAAVLASLE